LQVSNTLERVFNGQNEEMQAALVKLSLFNGVQFDFSMARTCLKRPDSGDEEETVTTTTLNSLVKAHLLQMVVKVSSTVQDQTVGNVYENEDTCYFLHSILQNLLERICKVEHFCRHVETAKLNLQAYMKNKFLELGEMNSCEDGMLTSELQPLVMYCSAPSIDDNATYIKALHFHTALQYFLNPKNLKQFYKDEAELAKGRGETLKWIFLELSHVDVLLKHRASLETAKKKLLEVKQELERLNSSQRGSRFTQALTLTQAHFNLVQGQCFGLCRHFEKAICYIKRALAEYEKVKGCKREAARALHAIGNIYSLKSVEVYTMQEAMNYYEKACEKIGASKVHFDLIVYSMNVGAKALVLGNMAKGKIEDVKKKNAILPEEDVKPDLKKMSDYYRVASTSFETSISLCEKLKMKRSLQYVEVSRNKALLLAESDDIEKVEEAVKLAEKSYKLMQEYDKQDNAQMAMCCFAIAEAHKKLGSKIFDAMGAKEGSDQKGKFGSFMKNVNLDVHVIVSFHDCQNC
jgi:tetratricopeptide (TPR) repeat protein